MDEEAGNMNGVLVAVLSEMGNQQRDPDIAAIASIIIMEERVGTHPFRIIHKIAEPVRSDQ
jgi:hypothetical protein